MISCDVALFKFCMHQIRNFQFRPAFQPNWFFQEYYRYITEISVLACSNAAIWREFVESCSVVLLQTWLLIMEEVTDIIYTTFSGTIVYAGITSTFTLLSSISPQSLTWKGSLRTTSITAMAFSGLQHVHSRRLCWTEPVKFHQPQLLEVIRTQLNATLNTEWCLMVYYQWIL